MKLVFLIIFSMLAGCSGISHIDTIQAPLSKSEGVYIPVGLDGYHEGRQQPVSGRIVAERMQSAVQSHMHLVRVGDSVESFDEALAAAHRLGLRYMVYTTILDWKDEATPMASVQDAVRIKIEFVDVSTHDVIDSAVLAKRSSIFSTEKTGPQQMISVPLKKYVDGVFADSKNLAEEGQDEPGFFTRLWR